MNTVEELSGSGQIGLWRGVHVFFLVANLRHCHCWPDGCWCLTDGVIECMLV